MNGEKTARGRLIKIFIVLAGIFLGQAILYGPSLIGWKILLPLDLLADPGVYIPNTAGITGMTPHDEMLADLINNFEPSRQFAISEIQQGRFPSWSPCNYAGVPFVWPKYSVFILLECCVKSPVILAWGQLFGALVAGTGMYFFCRQLLRVGFWPAAICAWCYPLTAFFVLWQGYSVGLPVLWLPWLFLSIDKTVRGGRSLPVIGLSVTTFLVLTGQVDIAGQALLGSGIYAVWCLWDLGSGEWFRRKFANAAMKLVAGWGLGMLLAAPYLLPLIEYSKTGSRMTQRSAGVEERPPIGLAALPQVVLPDIYGTTEKGSCLIVPASEAKTNLMESPSAAYAGIFATLLVAPLAWCNRQRRAANACWILIALFGLSWCLDIPGFVNLLRLPGLNMMSHNRLVFLASFAILALTAVGLENLLAGVVRRRWWFWPPAILLAGLCGWCFYRSMVLPEPIATQMEQAVLHHDEFQFIHDLKGVHEVQAWFIRHYTVAALFCGLGFVGWLLLWFQKSGRFGLFPIMAVLLMGDLLWFGYGRSAQCDPSLYYPKIPVLDEISKSVPGRVIGMGCLPPLLGIMSGLNDIRGYDAVDPARMVELLETAAEPGDRPPYAATQLMMPKAYFLPPRNIGLSPVLDMLDVRYAIFRGVPPGFITPQFQGNDYWVLVNSNALPRAFIPKSVKTIPDARDELKELSSPQFNPAEVAYVESPVKLPAACSGEVKITREIPTRITMSVRMETPGLVVLADNWDKGWHAGYNGKPAQILRANYAVRGVIVPAGNGTLEFIYRPASLILGLWLAGFAAIVLSCWLIIIWMQSRNATVTPIKPNL
jgi:hypothetical protein